MVGSFNTTLPFTVENEIVYDISGTTFVWKKYEKFR